MMEKIKEWIEEVRSLAAMAKCDPHEAYSAYVFGLSHKWRYYQRTVPGIAHLFQPLEDEISNILIPAIVGRPINEIERRVVSLPARLGGLAISNPVETADAEFEYSSMASTQLQYEMMCAQANVHFTPTREPTGTEIEDVKKMKEERLKTKFQDIYTACSVEGIEESDMQRAITLAQEKGSSIWLTTLPIENMGYNLNKQEFHDALAMRYNWRITGMPQKCACNKPNSIDHALSCPNGGYVILRHNELRNLEAKLLNDVCTDVKKEPPLIPLSGQQLSASTAKEDDARLDISCRGFWSRLDKTFFDVRVTHLNVKSNRDKKSDVVYTAHEQEKKRKYEERIIQVEKATMTPLVFATSGGQSRECEKFHKRLAELLAIKRGETYSDTIRTIRLQVRFSLIRTTLTALRGYRAPTGKQRELNLEEMDFSIQYSPDSANQWL